MPKYLIDMPKGWKVSDCWSGENCYKCYRYHDSYSDYCPLANAVEAVEVRLVEDGEAGAAIIDKTGRFYYEGDTLYAVLKEAK